MATVSTKSELKLTTAAGGLGVLTVLLDLIQGGGLSESLLLALIGGVTLIAVGYNVSRGLAVKEVRVVGSPSTGISSSQFKVSAALGGLGVLPIMLDMLREHEERLLSERVTIALVVAVSTIVTSFVVSRGMSKEEPRGAPMIPED